MGRRVTIQHTGPACLRCGCEEQVHHHYRTGLDCGRCGRDKCPEYLTRGTKIRRVLFEAFCYTVALAVLLGIILYLKWIF